MSANCYNQSLAKDVEVSRSCQITHRNSCISAIHSPALPPALRASHALASPLSLSPPSATAIPVSPEPPPGTSLPLLGPLPDPGLPPPPPPSSHPCLL